MARILAVGTEAGRAAVYFWTPADLIAKPEWQQFLGEVAYRATCDDLPLDVRPR